MSSPFARYLRDQFVLPAGTDSLEARAAARAGQLFVVQDDHPSVPEPFWSLKAPHQPRPISTHDTQTEAIAAGRELAQSWPHLGSLRIQGVDGRFREERTYPRSHDPFPPRG